MTQEPVKNQEYWVNFEQISTLVSSEFQVEEALLEFNIPTYYLKQPQETKQPFLNLHDKLKKINFVAFLRKENGRLFQVFFFSTER